MQTRTELLRAIQKLPAQTPLFPRSQKENWIAWLLGYDEFPRKNPDRNAQAVYNALNNANYVIWLGAAAGVEPRLVKRQLGLLGVPIALDELDLRFNGIGMRDFPAPLLLLRDVQKLRRLALTLLGVRQLSRSRDHRVIILHYGGD